ncbi:MAG TPA: ArsR family transcriptional regulator [Gemmatimonadales bacterium]|nr:ArsR family transcriptional regulator [Gemmatimonadales bacterium]
MPDQHSADLAQIRTSAGSTRNRIVALLRRGPLTVDQMAKALDLTDNAIRAHLAQLEREGLIEPRERRRGRRKPSVAYGTTAALEQQLSRAYVPLLVELLRELRERLPAEALEDALRAVGHRLAESQRPLSGTLAERVTAAGTLLDELGGATQVQEQAEGWTIEGFGCPLAQAVPGHPEVCAAVESLLGELIGVPVTECCDRTADRPRCCFQVGLRLPESNGKVTS